MFLVGSICRKYAAQNNTDAKLAELLADVESS